MRRSPPSRRLALACLALVATSSCGHHSALIEEDLGDGYVLQAIDAPEDLTLYAGTRKVVEAPVLGYASDGTQIVIYRKDSKTRVLRRDGTTTATPFQLDLGRRPDADGNMKIHWFYY